MCANAPCLCSSIRARAECVLAHEIDHEGANMLSANELAWVGQMAGPTVMTLDIF